MTKKPMTAKQKRKRKRAIMRRRLLLLLLLVAAIISVCLFTPVFNLKTIEVRGNSAVSNERLTEAVAIAPETNLFKIRKKNVRAAVLKIPEIETVKVSRRLPSKLRLTVTETAPRLYFSYAAGYVVTNENGRVMALTDDNSSLDLLYVTGLEIKNAEICEKMSVQDTVKFDIIVDTVKQLQDKGLLSEMRSCHFDNLSDCYAYLKDGTKIIFGKTSDLDYKLSVLVKVLPQVNRTEGAYIDLTTPSRTVYGTRDPEPTATPEPNGEDETGGKTSTEEQTGDEGDGAEEDGGDSEATAAPSDVAASGDAKASNTPTAEPDEQ